MSKFTNTLKSKLEDIKRKTYDIDTEKLLNDLYKWVNDKEGEDLEDVLSDYSEAEKLEYFRNNKSPNLVLIEVPNIAAESELAEVLNKFKCKYALTEIL